MASSIRPLAPLPERGFMNAVGSAPTKSAFSPHCLTAHAMPSIIMPIAPDARNTPTATRMATR